VPKRTYTMNNFSGGINNLKDPRDLKEDELANGVDIMIDKQGAIRTRGGEAGYEGTIADATATAESGYGLAVFESDYGVENSSYKITGSSDIDFAADEAASNTIETQDVNAYTKFPVGSVISVTGTKSNNGFFKVFSAAGEDLKISPSPVSEADTSAVIKRHVIGETFVALADAATGTVDIWKRTQGTWDTSVMNLRSDGTNTMLATNPSKVSYYFVDNAIRACDTDFENSSVIRWFGYIERIHFENTTSNDFSIQNTIHNFEDEPNSLDAPTVAVVDTTAGAGSSGLYPTAGAGFNLSFIETADTASTWIADTYQIATSLIYDDNQESLLYVPTSSNTFVVTAGNRLTLRVRAIKGFGNRVSGGRIYCRPSGSDDEPWTLLLDISLRKGARASLDADYVQRTETVTDVEGSSVTLGKTGWNPLSDSAGSGETEVYTELVDSLKQNLDTYDTINGYSPTIDSVSLGGINEGWKTAVVANRRTFIANVKIINQETGQPVVYGDRVMYSMPNKFDTFPSTNFIDVVKGDAENYVKLEEYADRLLAFKQKSVQIINISSPSDTNWFLEENIKHNGVQHPAAVVRTDYGICWVNESGCYLYDGRKITNLIDSKIADTSDTNELFPPAWSDFIYTLNTLGFSIVGYEKRRKQLIVMKDCSGVDHHPNDNAAQSYGGNTANGQVHSGDAYIYDFKTRAWIFAKDAFTDEKKYTNFVVDWQGRLFFCYFDGSSTVETRYWSDISANQTKINITTRDIDFGDPSHIKKVYKVYATYKSSADQITPLEYSIDGKDSWSDFSTGSNVSPAGGNSGDLDAVTAWDVATFTADSIPSCQSIQFRFKPQETAGTFDINDISVEYRPIHKRVS
jgi:hypothetical protein